MKTLKLIFEFFIKNKIPAIIIFVTFTVVLFMTNYNMSLCRYITYTKDMFVNTETKNSLYCMPNFDTDSLMAKADTFDPFGEELDKIENEAKKYKAYTPFKRAESFVSLFNGSQIDNFLFTQDMVDEYRINLSAGSWNGLTEESEYLNCIVSGRRFDYLNVGDITEIEIIDDYNSKTTNVKVKVVGKLANPNIIPQFNRSGTNIQANKIYRKLDGMIFMKSDKLSKIMNDANVTQITQNNFMTAYKEGSSENDRKEYREFLEKKLYVRDYNQILEETNKQINKNIRTKLPTPIFLLIIVGLSLISLSVLFVNKKIREHSIYYLCGCNRRKSYFIISCAIGLMGLLGGLLNILFIVNYDFLTSNGIINMSDGLIYDGQTVLFTLLYALAVSAVSVIISILVFRKNSPIEIYRKYES